MGQFQFLSVVTAERENSEPSHHCFSFFQLLLDSPRPTARAPVKFQFLSVVTLPSNALPSRRSGFSFFQLLLLENHEPIFKNWFQFLSVVTTVNCRVNKFRGCFSFFQLLLTLRALDLHVSFRVYKSSPPLNAFSLPNSFKGFYRTPLGREVKGKVTH